MLSASGCIEFILLESRIFSRASFDLPLSIILNKLETLVFVPVLDLSNPCKKILSTKSDFLPFQLYITSNCVIINHPPAAVKASSNCLSVIICLPLVIYSKVLISKLIESHHRAMRGPPPFDKGGLRSFRAFPRPPCQRGLSAE